MPTVLYEKKGKVVYITLNRPEVLNAINFETWGELIRAWERVRDDPDVWVAVVTGVGDRAFSAGQDLKEVTEEMAKAEKEGRPARVPIPDITPVRGMQVWKPFIAAINGIATGAGLELAMVCDIRIAADNARLGLREPVQSLMPGGGGTQRLPRLVPLCKALEVLFTGDFIDAQEAYRIGLVNKVVPRTELMPQAEAFANRLTENGPLALRAIKEAVYRGLEMTLNEGLQLELLLERMLFQTEDAKEGPRAFTEKRKPVYKGR